MPQSLSAVYIHLVFSTKDRRPLLRDKPTRDALHSYLGGVSKQLDCPPVLVGGVEDHVHLLARFGRTITQAEWVKELKRVSNLWLMERGRDYADFEWQGGSVDFSVSQSNLEAVKQYTAGQEEHHRKIGFQDELRVLLKRHEIRFRRVQRASIRRRPAECNSAIRQIEICATWSTALPSEMVENNRP